MVESAPVSRTPDHATERLPPFPRREPVLTRGQPAKADIPLESFVGGLDASNPDRHFQSSQP